MLKNFLGSSFVVAMVFIGSVFIVESLAQRGGVFRGSRDHDAIRYSTGATDNAIVSLNRELLAGVLRFDYDEKSGYLQSVLKGLDIPVESQVTVFSPTSNQATLIESSNPRAIYFGDDVSIGWVRGAEFLEVAAHDVQQGVVFYTLRQSKTETPQFVREDQCLACHLTWDTLGVPGLQVISTFPLTADPNAYATGFISDHRTSLRDRWGGWYVTGKHKPFLHMGNVEVTDVEDADATVGTIRTEMSSLAGLFDLDGFLSMHSDVVALMVLEHQVHMTNLITRIGWEARRLLYRLDAGDIPSDSFQPDALLHEIAVELVDYLLFVDEAQLVVSLEGSSDFSRIFSERGPRDRMGRSLRDFDLQTRLMRYPCSYMIYSTAFDALPTLAKDAIHERLWAVLSGREKQAPYNTLTFMDRQAIVEILLGTKSDLPSYFRAITS
tara:strand:- start:1115 stop:2428 length:1314 start_codon:yes stop_codon:yes gene_type:complete